MKICTLKHAFTESIFLSPINKSIIFEWSNYNYYKQLCILQIFTCTCLVKSKEGGARWLIDTKKLIILCHLPRKYWFKIYLKKKKIFCFWLKLIELLNTSFRLHLFIYLLPLFVLLPVPFLPLLIFNLCKLVLQASTHLICSQF